MKSFDPETISIVDWKKINPSYKVHKSLNCPECGKCVSQFCSGCHSVGYCSKEHQKNHWLQGHKNECCAYKLVKKEGHGRILIVTRDIEPGEVIFEESPITVGPKQFCQPVCLGCYKNVNGTSICSGCNWPMCGNIECEKAPIHSKKECALLADCHLKPIIDLNKPEKDLPIYQFLTALRCLLVKEFRPDNWSILESMESHTELRKNEESYRVNQVNIVKFILERIKYDTTVEDINKCIDVMDVNAFEIRSHEFSIAGLYPMTAMMNSNCSPNTQNSIDENYICRVMAITRIPKGSEINSTYTRTLSGTLYRRNQLKESKYFDCKCERCCDPTELNSHFSTLLCQAILPSISKTCKGFVYSENSLNTNASWICRACGAVMSHEEVTELTQKLEVEIEKEFLTIDDYENFLKNRLLKFLHPNHYIIVDFKFILMKALSRAEYDPEIRIQREIRKKRIIEDILDVHSLITPGYFRIRAMLVSERCMVMMSIAFHNLSNSNKNEIFLEECERIIDGLEECVSILRFENTNSVEGQRYKACVNYIEKLKNIIEMRKNKTMIPASS
ncbi:SET domain-containing protein SmydA-8 [Lepeophtheirus salmonis]|nr:SET domain-containing protein SmydA-8-like [Lepeophtheirus salmonis]